MLMPKLRTDFMARLDEMISDFCDDPGISDDEIIEALMERARQLIERRYYLEHDRAVMQEQK
jgi:hypothetical protein